MTVGEHIISFYAAIDDENLGFCICINLFP